MVRRLKDFQDKIQWREMSKKGCSLKKLACLAIVAFLCSGCEKQNLKTEAKDWMRAAAPFGHGELMRFEDLRVVVKRKRVCGAFSAIHSHIDGPREEKGLFIYERGKMVRARMAYEKPTASPDRFLKQWKECASDECFFYRGKWENCEQ